MWMYNNKEIRNLEDLNIEKEEGFVYLITLIDGKKYIGKKSFWNRVKLPPLKGKKRKRKVVKESKWVDYTSSSSLITVNNITKKEILEVCDSKRELTYKEIKFQFAYNVLEDDDFINKNIFGKFFKGNLS